MQKNFLQSEVFCTRVEIPSSEYSEVDAGSAVISLTNNLMEVEELVDVADNIGEGSIVSESVVSALEKWIP